MDGLQAIYDLLLNIFQLNAEMENWYWGLYLWNLNLRF